MVDAGSPLDKKFDSLVAQWGHVRGTGKGHEATCMIGVLEVIRGTKVLLTVQEKPNDWGDTAYPGGLPMTWPEYQQQILRPLLERLQKLLEHVAGRLPFP